MKTFVKVAVPVGILLLAGGISAVLMATRKKPEIAPTPPKPTLVQAITTAMEDRVFRVRTQGTVQPLRETMLIPEVSGRIVATSPAFQAGGFFETGDVLIEIDPANYESTVAQAEFNLAQARLKLEQELARADQARKEWQSLGRGEPPALVARVPQVQAEEANVKWSEQALEKARLDLARTKIRAPYAGMVREKRADLGQFVSPGTQLGTIFAVDEAEVRLPVSLQDLAYLDLPHGYRGEAPANPVPVTLRARIAGRMHEWPAHIVRTEGTIDPSSRMLYVVARIRNPYARAADSDRPPLQMGQFVEAEISGRSASGVVVLPRQVLRGGDRVLVVDPATSELRTRRVEVLKTDPDVVVIGSGIAPGELVCTTALEFVVEGMKVELYSDAPAAPTPIDAGRLADAEKTTKNGGPL
ncbi:efflux RND transporter periplasmic adaptor subunit [Opitutales bacterium ASA1]|uniref:efflux RND transporter periplasmic adaptor subunit n=1 Tax=Congregicoccus parvus TaxID=3081749 RepID=UPI002B3069F1|nr:efflux RND transporter periplasmic adaptor subunit [Opitutales bacterium ASA1]